MINKEKWFGQIYSERPNIKTCVSLVWMVCRKDNLGCFADYLCLIVMLFFSPSHNMTLTHTCIINRLVIYFSLPIFSASQGHTGSETVSRVSPFIHSDIYLHLTELTVSAHRKMFLSINLKHGSCS